MRAGRISEVLPAPDAAPTTESQGVVLHEESDDEYEDVPLKKKRAQDQKQGLEHSIEEATGVAAQNPQEPQRPAEGSSGEVPGDDTFARPLVPQVVSAGVDDDEWLRSRTSRLLDLVDPDELARPETQGNMECNEDAPGNAPDDAPEKLPHLSEDTGRPMEADSALDVTHTPADVATSRLFIRNLSYTVTEDDLRTYFEKYGPVEEVRSPRGVPLPPLTA